jgi:hypothetical protein
MRDLEIQGVAIHCPRADERHAAYEEEVRSLVKEALDETAAQPKPWRR